MRKRKKNCHCKAFCVMRKRKKWLLQSFLDITSKRKRKTRKAIAKLFELRRAQKNKREWPFTS